MRVSVNSLNRFIVLGLLPLVFSGCTLTEYLAEKSRYTRFREKMESLVTIMEEQGATVGVSIQSLDDGKSFTHNGGTCLIPASTQKVILASRTLFNLPRDFHWRTDLIAEGAIDSNGCLQGDLILRGSWDPSLSARPVKMAMDPWFALREWVLQMKADSIKSVNGNLVLCGKMVQPGSWEYGDMRHRYAPVISQISWNNGLLGTTYDSLQNTFELYPEREYWSANHLLTRTIKPLFSNPPPLDSIRMDWIKSREGFFFPVRNPLLLAGDGLRQAMVLAGIAPPDSVVIMEPEDFPGFLNNDSMRVYSHFSPPLDTLLQSLLIVSDNLWAEMIGQSIEETEEAVSLVGEAGDTIQWKKYLQDYLLRSPSAPNSPGTRDFLFQCGIDAEGVRAIDYCGLARRNRLSAEILTRVMRWSLELWGERFVNLMPEPGDRFSTFEHRLLSCKGHFAGKSGSMSGVEGITGYVLDDQGQPVAIVTILVNGCIHLLPSARSLVDKMVLEAVTFYAGGN